MRHRALRFESLSPRIVLADDVLADPADMNPADVNQDGTVAPGDALQVNNTMNDTSATPEEQAAADVNQDGALTMDDYEAVVDALIAANAVSGGGSGTSATPCGFDLSNAISPAAALADDWLPRITIDSPPSDANEYEIFTLTGTFRNVSYVQLCGAVTFAIVGDINQHGDGTWTAQAMFMDNRNGVDPSPMEIYAVGDVGAAYDSTEMTIHNTSPTITGSLSATEIDEGESTTLVVEVTDWGHEDAHTIVVDWGEGPLETYELPGEIQGEWSMNYTAFLSYGPRVRQLEIPPHQYLDDNPSNSSADNYAVTYKVIDDDGASDTKTATVLVKDVAPTVTITSIEVIDAIAGNPGQLDESERFIVHGTVTDPGVLDTFPVAKVEVDLNFDGTIDPITETFNLTLQGGNGSWTFEKIIMPVLDDGASYDGAGNRIWGNQTALDSLSVYATIEDDDTGTRASSHFLPVFNAEPRFLGLPDFDMEFDDEGVPVVAILSGTFDDAGTLDYHQVIVEWGDGAITTAQLPLGSRYYEVKRPLPASFTVHGSIFPLTAKLEDDDLGMATVTIGDTCSSPTPAMNLPQPEGEAAIEVAFIEGEYWAKFGADAKTVWGWLPVTFTLGGAQVPSADVNVIQKLERHLGGTLDGGTTSYKRDVQFTELIGFHDIDPSDGVVSADQQVVAIGSALRCGDHGHLFGSGTVYAANTVGTSPDYTAGQVLFDNTGTDDQIQKYWDGNGWVNTAGFPKHIAPYLQPGAMLHNGVLSVANYTQVASYKSKLIYVVDTSNTTKCRVTVQFTTLNSDGSVASEYEFDSGPKKPCDPAAITLALKAATPGP